MSTKTQFHKLGVLLKVERGGRNDGLDNAELGHGLTSLCVQVNDHVLEIVHTRETVALAAYRTVTQPVETVRDAGSVPTLHTQHTLQFTQIVSQATHILFIIRSWWQTYAAVENRCLGDSLALWEDEIQQLRPNAEVVVVGFVKLLYGYLVGFSTLTRNTTIALKFVTPALQAFKTLVTSS